MAVLSALKPTNHLQYIRPLLKTIVRNAGHGKQMPVRPSVYQWRKFKDALHWYTMIGFIPLALITTYINITVGPAELTDIPEGYEPHHWEYHKNPISRFMAKYMIRDKRIDYELMTAYMNEESEKMILNNVERQVKDFMARRSDYKSWFYRPIYGDMYRADRALHNQHLHVEGEHTEVGDETHFSNGGDPSP